MRCHPVETEGNEMQLEVRWPLNLTSEILQKKLKLFHVFVISSNEISSSSSCTDVRATSVPSNYCKYMFLTNRMAVMMTTNKEIPYFYEPGPVISQYENPVLYI